MSDRLKAVRIVYFSGTGCTALVADTFRRELEARGSRVELGEIRHGAIEPAGEFDLLILCFVVHAGAAPHPVLRWAEEHRPVSAVPAALIPVCGGGEMSPNLAAGVAVKRRLRRKGFRMEYEKFLSMPANWVVPTPPAVASRLLEVLPAKVAFIVDELAAGLRRRSRPGPGNRLLSLLGKLETAGAKRFGKRIGVAGSCTGCGRCADRCPVANITMEDGKPVFGSRCVLCLRCIYGCPSGSLSPSVMKFMAIGEGFDLERIRATVPWPGVVDVETEARGPLWIGVRRYLLDTSDLAQPRYLG